MGYAVRNDGRGWYAVSQAEDMPPGYTYSEAQPAEVVPDQRAAMVVDVDNHISAIYNRFTRFDQEYFQREAAARAFKAAGYVGDPTVWVSAFAGNVGMSNQAASDLIIAQADQLRGALQSLGAQRMRKYGITAAATLEAASALYADIIASADAIAATL